MFINSTKVLIILDLMSYFHLKIAPYFNFQKYHQIFNVSFQFYCLNLLFLKAIIENICLESQQQDHLKSNLNILFHLQQFLNVKVSTNNISHLIEIREYRNFSFIW